MQTSGTETGRIPGWPSFIRTPAKHGDQPPPVGWLTRVFYPMGSASVGIKQRTLAAFAMIYYNQVIGLSPALVGSVLMLITIFDALCDPIVGQWSDNFRSPWGRRHPFMYLAVVPVPVFFFLMWNPPVGLSDSAAAVYLFVCLAGLRFFDTLFELPAAALMPELTSDYQERTILSMGRHLYGAVVGLSATVIALKVFMPENPDGTGGLLDRAGYLPFSIAFACAMLVFMLAAAISTHRRIPYFRPPPARAASFGVMAREIVSTLSNRGFVILALASMLMSIAAGARTGLEMYFSVYFWELSQSKIALMISVAVAGSLCGGPLAIVLSRALGKKGGVLAACGLMIVLALGPIALRVAGLMPPNGAPILFPILAVDMFLYSAVSLALQVIIMSSYADVVDDSEVKTGRRSEGLLLSADNLFKKMVSAIGVFTAGMVLTLVAFPAKAQRGMVDPEVLQQMGLIYVPLLLLVLGPAFLLLTRYPIDEARHRENLRTLADRQATSA